MCKLLLQASVDNCPEVRGHMAGFCRFAADGAMSPTPSCLSRCVASAVFSVIPESNSRRLTVAGLALAEVLQEEELGEVSIVSCDYFSKFSSSCQIRFVNILSFLSVDRVQGFRSQRGQRLEGAAHTPSKLLRGREAFGNRSAVGDAPHRVPSGNCRVPFGVG